MERTRGARSGKSTQGMSQERRIRDRRRSSPSQTDTFGGVRPPADGDTRMSGSIPPAPMGLRDVLAGAPDVIFCCDQEGRWVWISPSIEALVGYRPADLIGHLCTGLIA